MASLLLAGSAHESVVAERAQVEDEAMAHVAPSRASRASSTLPGRNDLDVGDDVVFAAEVEQILGVMVSAASG